MLKHYLLERVIRHYVKNVEQVLQQFSISRLLFGSVKLERVDLVPESIQDALFSYVFYACEFKRVTAVDVEVSLEWLSISTRSVQFRVRSLEVELLLYDPECPKVAQGFWDAQGMRLKAESEYMRSPAESTLLYKVLGGLDVIVDSISVDVQTPSSTEPAMLVNIARFRYCPASQSGAPTNDLTLAMRPNSRLGEVAYNYWLEMGCLAFSLPPQAGEAKQPKAELALDGFAFSSFGKVPANGRLEAPFYATTVNSLEIRALRAGAAGAPMPMEVLLPLVALISLAWNSDDLRDGRRESSSSDSLAAIKPVEAETRSRGRKTSKDDLLIQTEEARLHVRERLLAAQQTKSDMADLLKGCSRTSRQRATSPEGGDAPGAPASPSSQGRPRAKSRSALLGERDADFVSDGFQSDEDGDDFKDCEEDEIIDPGELPGSAGGHPAKLRECFRQGPLKRFMFSIGGCCFQIAGQDGSVGVHFSDFRASTDKRRDFTPQEVECLCSLFELPAPLKSPSHSSKSDTPTGIIYAGVFLDSAHLSFAPRDEPEPADVFRLRRGLKLWHRGTADVLLIAAGPVQVMEVEVSGILVRDHGRESVTAMWNSVSEALAPSPGPIPPPGPEVAIGYSLQALDIVLEAGSPRWRCSLPCLRLSSVLRGLDDLWSYTNWAPEVTRSPTEPLGSTAVEPVERPWWEPPRRAPRAEPLPRRRGGGADDVIADLEQQLAEERSALGAEKTRTAELDAKLRELLRVLRSWPEGPLPLALQHLLDEATGRDCSHGTAEKADAEKAVADPCQKVVGGPSPQDGKPQTALQPRSRPLLPGLQLVTYDLDFGKTVQHVVEGLQRGDAVQWFLEEVHDRAVDVRAVLRSRRKLHAARCLRDTERTSRRRDFFKVTDDFGEEQLPLTLEIHLSNSSWFSERRVRLKLCRVEGGALQGDALPWPALACPEDAD